MNCHKENYGEALKILDLISNDNKENFQSADGLVGDILLSLGNVHTKKGSYDQAIKLYKESLNIKRFRRDNVGVACVKDHIGDLFKSARVANIARSRAFYSDALRLKTKNLGCDNQDIATTLTKLAKLFVDHDPKELKFAERLLNEGKIFYVQYFFSQDHSLVS